MKCEQAREQIVDRWTGRLTGSGSAALDEHLAACTACRDEAEGLEPMWRLLGDSADAEVPSPSAHARFQSMLEAYRLGAWLGAGRAQQRKTVVEVLRGLWPSRPAWQFAVACTFLRRRARINNGGGSWW